MWKAVHESVAGTSHEVLGTPCQDAHSVTTVSVNGREFLIVVCADGAGSAKHSDRGAAFVCASMAEILGRKLSSGVSLTEVTRESAVEWCRELRIGLAQVAAELNCVLRDLASTLLIAAVSDDCSFFVQLGDGAIVAQYDGLYEVVFWPQSGEFVNTTNFLSDETFEDRLEFSSRIGIEVTDLAVFTDGLEHLILQYSDRTVHVPFLEPLFQSLAQCSDPKKLFEPLRQFLTSDRVNQRTDDDKTLVLATREQAQTDANAVC